MKTYVNFIVTGKIIFFINMLCFIKKVSGCYDRQGGTNSMHKLRYVCIAYFVQCAEYLMGYEAKYYLSVTFISFAIIRNASAID